MNADRSDSSPREAPRTPLREHVAVSIQRYLGDLNGNDTDNLYAVALRELEIPLFVEVLNFCDGNQSSDQEKGEGLHHPLIQTDSDSRDYTRRSTIIFLISAIALAGFKPFGQVCAQFMIVWQR